MKKVVHNGSRLVPKSGLQHNMPVSLRNGDLRLLITLFLTALFVPLLAFAAGYGALSSKVASISDIYATKLEVEQLNGDIKGIKIILQNSPWYTPEVKRQVDDLQRKIDERNRRADPGYSSSQKDNTPPG
jgi:hypothetical protein